jgi:putative acetyltransferase
MSDVDIRPIQPQDQDETRQLILDGLAGHWGWLDPSKNPDLDDIASSYAGALFLVARLDGRLVGSGVLVPRGECTAEIVRMSVAADVRRKGIGRLILQRLCEHARQNDFQRIVLETTETWHEVVQFYLDYGFRITHHLDGDAYFILDLTKE